MVAARAQSDSCSASPQHLLLLSCSHLVVHESVLLDDTIDVTSSHTVADLQTPQAAILVTTLCTQTHCQCANRPCAVLHALCSSSPIPEALLWLQQTGC